MSLTSQLSAICDNFQGNTPAPVIQTINTTNSVFKSPFKQQSTIKVGEILPSFALSDSAYKEVTSADLFLKGLILITFYRGECCPF